MTSTKARDMEDLTLKGCKELDRALESLCRGGDGYTAEQADRLASDGYASAIRTNTGNAYFATEAGKSFLRSGGYAAAHAKKEKQKIEEDKGNRKECRRKIRAEVWVVLGLIISAIGILALFLQD